MRGLNFLKIKNVRIEPQTIIAVKTNQLMERIDSPRSGARITSMK
jgi:hypothetical protein